MPQFYFHLSAPNQVFEDKIGSDLGSLSAAHGRALLLASRVMMMFDFADRTSDFRRWTVEITDDNRRPLVTVKFPTDIPRAQLKAAPNKGVRLLLQRLETALRTSRQTSHAGLAGNRSARRVASRRAQRGKSRAH
jgi:hypothetical protein